MDFPSNRAIVWTCAIYVTLSSVIFVTSSGVNVAVIASSVCIFCGMTDGFSSRNRLCNFKISFFVKNVQSLLFQLTFVNQLGNYLDTVLFVQPKMKPADFPYLADRLRVPLRIDFVRHRD